MKNISLSSCNKNTSTAVSSSDVLRTRSTIAILGATGHIGKALAHAFYSVISAELAEREYMITLFSRAPDSLSEFQIDGFIGTNDIDEFSKGDFDVIINCVGIGNPAKLKADPGAIFEVTEKFDTLVIEYLENHPLACYINMSSGAVYGKNAGEAVNDGSRSIIGINAMSSADFYSIAKINSEARHRARPDLNIIDLRVFSFFSRFIDLNSGFMMAELVTCIKNNETFITAADDMIRDYVVADDLLSLIENCMAAVKNMKQDLKQGKDVSFNHAFDVYSKSPISKFELLEMLRASFGLKYEIKKTDGPELSPTGTKKEYFSKSRKAEALGFVPAYSSIEGIEKEIKAIIS